MTRPDVPGLDPATIQGLPNLISTARLRPYLDACSGDSTRAVRLYTWNLEISAAFWGEIHVLEVTLRNAIHDQLAHRYRRKDWWQDPRAKLHHVMKSQLDDAFREAAKTAAKKNRPPVAGDVVASLSLGFWSGFTGSGRGLQYETLYWQPALHKAFPNYQGQRSDLSRTLDSIRLFRNRIAHHEPIFGRHLAADHQSIVRVAGYLSNDASAYIAALTRVPAVLSRRSTVVEGGVGCSF